MARSTSRVAGINSSLVDGELDGFFIETHSAYRYRVGLRACCSGGAHCWIHLARAHASPANEMGADPAFTRAVALHGSNGRAFSVEFPLAAIFPFDSSNLCSGCAANAAGVIDRGYSGSRSRCLDGYRDVDLPRQWQVRFPADMDFSRARNDLVAVSAFVARF